MFNNYTRHNILTIKQFLDVLKYMKGRNLDDKFELKQEISLDISYNFDKTTFNTYRISIKNIPWMVI